VLDPLLQTHNASGWKGRAAFFEFNRLFTRVRRNIVALLYASLCHRTLLCFTSQAELNSELDEIARDKDAGAAPGTRPSSARSKGAVSHVSYNDSANESDDDDDDDDRRLSSKNFVSKDDFQM